MTWRDRVRALVREVALLRKHNRKLINALDHYGEMCHHTHAERRRAKKARRSR